LAGIDSCSFVLVSAAIELKGTDIRVAWCGPMLIGAAASGEEMVEGRGVLVGRSGLAVLLSLRTN
jgi:hypothetical protein